MKKVLGHKHGVKWRMCLTILSTIIWLTACQFVSEKPSLPAASLEAETSKSFNPYLAIKRSVSRDALARFSESMQFIDSQQWPAAQQSLLGLIHDYPDFSGPMVNLAIVYESQGLDQEAENFYQKARKVNRLNLDAHNRYAVFLRERGRFLEAEKVYLEALSVWQEHPDSHRNLAILYDLYMGRFNDALNHYRQYALLIDDEGAPEDKQVKRWISDLKKRIQQQATAAG